MINQRGATMNKAKKEDLMTMTAQVAVGLSALIAVVIAPALAIGAAVGGYLGSKASTKIAQKKYGPRDIGGVFPGAMVVITGTTSSALLGGYAGHTLLEAFQSSASDQKSAIHVTHNDQIASNPVQAMLDKPIAHNGKTAVLTLATA
jgi:phage tail tape-measure protein